MNKRTDRLTPADVKVMTLAEFERRFGWRPADALEKAYFAATAERLGAFERAALEAGVLGDIDITTVVMEEG